MAQNVSGSGIVLPRDLNAFCAGFWFISARALSLVPTGFWAAFWLGFCVNPDQILMAVSATSWRAPWPLDSGSGARRRQVGFLVISITGRRWVAPGWAAVGSLESAFKSGRGTAQISVTL